MSITALLDSPSEEDLRIGRMLLYHLDRLPDDQPLPTMTILPSAGVDELAYRLARRGNHPQAYWLCVVLLAIAVEEAEERARDASTSGADEDAGDAHHPATEAP